MLRVTQSLISFLRPRAIPDRPRPPSSLTHRQRPSFGLSLTFSLTTL